MTIQRARMPQDEPQATPHTHLAPAPRSSRDGWEDGAEAREVERIPDLETFARIHGIEVAHAFLPLAGIDPRWIAGLRRQSGPLFLVLFTRTHSTQPLLTDILASLAKDAAAVETSVTVEYWARTVGLPLGQNPGQKYLTARLQARRLREWLPTGAYETLLWNINQT